MKFEQENLDRFSRSQIGQLPKGSDPVTCNLLMGYKGVVSDNLCP